MSPLTLPKKSRAERRAEARENPGSKLSKDEKHIQANKAVSAAFYASEKAFNDQLKRFGAPHGAPKPPASPRAPKVTR